jgi:hypothetical protein
MSVENQQFTEVFHPLHRFQFAKILCIYRGSNADLKIVKAHIGLSEKYYNTISNCIVVLKSQLFQVSQTLNQPFVFPE